MTTYHIPSLIIKKRRNLELSDGEIDFLVNVVAQRQEGDNTLIDDAQIGDLLMAIKTRGMTDRETTQLTKSMTESGTKLEWPDEWRHLVVDKHSTGGVGDKVTLVLTPALAACGLKVPTITGRSLAHTGGTLDKLESIPRFSCSFTSKQIVSMVTEIGCCIVGPAEDVARADKVLYPIRDATGTVDSIPLITGSILSKKIAENPTALVIDVKLGKAAVNPNEDYMRELARSLVSVANRQGVKTTVVLSRMNSPIGNMVGNSLEIAEVIECLHGRGPKPLTNLIQHLGGHLLNKVGRVNSVNDGESLIASVLGDGRAMDKFKAMLQTQGVATDTVEQLCTPGADVFQVLPRASQQTDICADKSGYIVEIDAMVCATVSASLGAGRRNANDDIDYAVGIQLHRHVGDFINNGDKVMIVHHSDSLSEEVKAKLRDAIAVLSQPLDDDFINNLVIDVMEDNSQQNMNVTH